MLIRQFKGHGAKIINFYNLMFELYLCLIYNDPYKQILYEYEDIFGTGSLLVSVCTPGFGQMRVNSSCREEMQDYICQSILDNHCVVSYDSQFFINYKKITNGNRGLAGTTKLAIIPSG